jgi:hypothetical protein
MCEHIGIPYIPEKMQRQSQHQKIATSLNAEYAARFRAANPAFSKSLDEGRPALRSLKQNLIWMGR